jgi:hypothetical protein
VVASAVVAQTAGGLVGGLTDVLGTLPDPTTPLGIIFYAAWGVFGVAGGKKLLGRFRSSGGPAPTVQQGSSEVKTGTTRIGSASSGGSTGGDDNSGFGQSVAFTLPAAVPVSEGIREVTTNEVHAVELGAIVGFVTLWLIHIGRRDAGIGLALLFVGGALGYKRYKSKALKTIRMEPWYALMAFGFGAVAGALFFDPSIVLQYV